MRTENVWAGNRAGDIEFCICDDLPTLVWLAQLAAIELHPSLAKVDDVERPTVLAFDLDPGEPATIVECCAVALRLRALFADFGLECFPKTSGSKGMQVYVPLNGEVTYDDTKPYANAVAKALESAEPDLVTSQMKKALRPGKVFVDWSQNSSTKTTVAVYSLRAKSPRPPRLRCAGTRSRQRRSQASRTTSGSAPTRCSPGSRITATCSRRCWSSSRSYPRARDAQSSSPEGCESRTYLSNSCRTTGLRAAAASSSRRTGVV